MAIDIAAFIAPEDFERDIQTFIGWLKSSRLMDGFTEIILPGELEYRKRIEKEADGVFIDDESWRQISATGAEVGVDLG